MPPLAPPQTVGSPYNKGTAAPAPTPTPNPTPSPTPPPAPVTESPTQWAGQVVSDLGINPTTDPNAVTDILSWMPFEENSSQWWGGFGTASDPTRIDPLNTGLQAYGYGPTPTTGGATASGLGTYPTLSNAAQAVAATLQEAPYTSVLSDLQSGASPSAFQSALSSSPWASGHYAGDTFSAASAGQAAGGPTVTAAGSIGSAPGAITPQLQSQINSAIQAYAQKNGLSAQQSSQLNQILSSMVENGQLQNAIGQQGSQDQLAYTGQEYANEQQQAQQQYGFEQAQFGIQGQQLGTEQTGLVQQRQNLYNQQVQAQRQYHLTQQSFANQLNNLIAGYGFTQQQQQQQAQATTSSEAASGVYNTGTRTRDVAAEQLQAAESAQQYGYSQQQLGVQQKQAATSYQSTQESQSFQWQQLQNANAQLDSQFAQLGLSKQEAQAGLQNALTNAGLQNVMTTDQLSQQLAMYQAGMASPLQSVISTLMSASPMISALVGG